MDTLDKVEKNHNRFFKNRESLSFLYINLKWRAKFQIYRLLIRDSDWLNLYTVLGYKHKIILVSILRKREDQLWLHIRNSSQELFNKRG